MIRALVLTVAMLLLAVGARAGEEDAWTPPGPPGGMPAEPDLVPTLRRWLRSGHGVEAAWAGWIASERRLAALAPELIDRLERDGKAEKREPFLAEVLLDALIHLECPVPSRALLPVYSEEAVTVLLCRRPTLETAHLLIFAKLDDPDGDPIETWLGLGNYLARRPVPAFVARVLGHYRVERRVRVFDRDGPYRPWRGPSYSVCGDGFARIPDGYPPVAIWRLSEYGFGRYRTLSAGPRPIYAARSVHRPKPKRCVGFGRVLSGDPTCHDVRGEWLSLWLADAGLPLYPPWATAEVDWRGGRRMWRRLVEGVYGDLYDRFRAWRDALFARGMLTVEAVRRLRPRIEIDLIDERDLRRWPLPSFEEPPFEPRLPRAARLKPRTYRGV